MDEVWMLDYQGAVFPHMGVFPSEYEAEQWVMRHDPERFHNYKPFRITVNRDRRPTVPTTSPEHSYRNQR